MTSNSDTSKIRLFLDKTFKRHSWHRKDKALIGVQLFGCNYCYKTTMHGAYDLAPIGPSYVDANSRCDRRAV